MKQIRFLFLFIFAILQYAAFSQVESTPTLVGKVFVSQTGGGPGYWQVTGNFTDESGYYDGSTIAVGTVLFFNDAGIGYYLPVTQVVSLTPPSFTVRVNNTGITGIVGVPTGSGSMFNPSPTLKLPFFTSGLSNSDQQLLLNYLVNRIESQLATADEIAFVSGTGVPATTVATVLGYKLAKNNGGDGVLYEWDGTQWVENQRSGGGGNEFETTSTINMTLIGPTVFADVISNSLDSTHIKDGGIRPKEINQSGATTGQILKWDGEWMPAKDLSDIVSGNNYNPASPLSGWEQPTGAKLGESIEVKFTDCKTVRYLYDGANWLVDIVTPTLQIDNTVAVGTNPFSGINWTGTGPYTYNSLQQYELASNTPLDNNAIYVISFSVSVVSGALWVQVGGGYAANSINVGGNYTFFITSYEEDKISFRPAEGGFQGTISNITLKKVQGCDNILEGATRIMGLMHLESGRISTPPTARISIGFMSSRGAMWDTTGYDIPGSSITIGNFSGNRGSQTAVGYYCGHSNEIEGVMTGHGKWCLRDNTTGHASGYGNACLIRNTTSDSHCFGDEACSQVTTQLVAGFGYYNLNRAIAPMSGYGNFNLMFATTGPNSGFGNFFGQAVTTGRVSGIGERGAQYVNTGTGVFVGHLAGTRPNDTDFSFRSEQNVICIGDSTYKADSSPMPYSITIGHGLKAITPDRLRIGYPDRPNFVNEFFGKMGINEPSPTTTLHLGGSGGIRVNSLGGASSRLLLADTDGNISRSTIGPLDVIGRDGTIGDNGVLFASPNIPSSAQTSLRLRFFNDPAAYLRITGDNVSNGGPLLGMFDGSNITGFIGSRHLILGGTNRNLLFHTGLSIPMQFSTPTGVKMEIADGGNVRVNNLASATTRLVTANTSGDLGTGIRADQVVASDGIGAAGQMAYSSGITANGIVTTPRLLVADAPSAVMTINGGSGVNEGSLLRFQKAGTNIALFGTQSNILGGTTNDLYTYLYGTNKYIVGNGSTFFQLAENGIASFPFAYSTGGNRLAQLTASGVLEKSSIDPATVPSGSGQTGRVTFWNGTQTVSSDAELTWDNVNKRLGIGTATPRHSLQIGRANTNNWVRLDRTTTSFEQAFQWTTGNPTIPTTGDWFFGQRNTSPATALRLFDYARGTEVLTFEANGNIYLTPSTSGRFGISTLTPQAQVHIRGVNSLGDSTSFLIDNSSGLSSAWASNNGNFNMGSRSGNRWSFNANGASFTNGVSISNTSITAGTISFPFSNLNMSGTTTGIGTGFNLSRTFNPSTGSQNFEGVVIAPIINQTGTANGAIYGYRYNPILTSLLGSHYAATFATGNVGIGTETPLSRFTNTTNAYFGGNAVATAFVHLAPGTITTAPFRFTQTGAARLTTPVAGSVEADSTRMYYTNSAGLRRSIAHLNDITTAPFNNTPSPVGININNGVIALNAADATNPGAVSTSSQTFGGPKTFKTDVDGSSFNIILENGLANTTGEGVALTATNNTTQLGEDTWEIVNDANTTVRKSTVKSVSGLTTMQTLNGATRTVENYGWRLDGGLTINTTTPLNATSLNNRDGRYIFSVSGSILELPEPSSVAVGTSFEWVVTFITGTNAKIQNVAAGTNTNFVVTGSGAATSFVDLPLGRSAGKVTCMTFGGVARWFLTVYN